MSNKKIIQRLVLLIVCLSLLIGSIVPTASASSSTAVRNVILLIGDGMGENQINFARAKSGSPLNIDSISKKYLVTTDSLQGYTDSAAAATAIAYGVKTMNKLLGYDKDKKRLEPITKKYQEKKKKIGLVSTCDITDGTPAAFAAQVTNRTNKPEIAKQILESNIDLLLGGGKSNFSADFSKEKGAGYTIVQNNSELQETDAQKVLGLFDGGHMKYEIDRGTSTPSLSQMAQKAIQLLDRNVNGFFLMVEGGRIDHTGHENNKNAAPYEVLAFDEAVKVALDFAKKDKNTLVIVTADHETGGLQTTDVNDVYAYEYTSTDHTRAKVPIYIYGPGSDFLKGNIHLTDIYTIMSNVIKDWKILAEPSSTSSKPPANTTSTPPKTSSARTSTTATSVSSSDSSDEAIESSSSGLDIDSSSESEITGEEVINSDIDTPDDNKDKQSKSGWLIYIGVPVIIVILAGGIWFIIYRKKQSK